MSEPLPADTRPPAPARPSEQSVPESAPPLNLRASLLRILAISIGLLLVTAAAVVTFLLVSNAGIGDVVTIVVLASAAATALAVLIIGAVSATRAVQEQFSRLRASAHAHHQEIQHAVERLRRGERISPRPADPPPLDRDQSQLLAHDLDRLRKIAVTALAEAPILTPAPATDHRVGVFVNLARRLQSLVHREIQLLDELEAQVEDPDLLKGLFSVDHLATRIRRHAENLAVLGGAVSRRQWSKPVNVYEVLRSAVAEVERYSRVKLVRPIDGTLQGHAVADVIHLIAELVENATMFSNPQTQVLLRAQRVTSGLAIEVEDRGLGMALEDQQRVNGMLAAPDQIDLDELLRDGRIGLYVVSALARRHGVAVALQTNIYGGVQAVIVLPPGLLGASGPDQQVRAPEPASRPAPEQASRLAREPEPRSVLEPRSVPVPAARPAVPAAPISPPSWSAPSGPTPSVPVPERVGQAVIAGRQPGVQPPDEWLPSTNGGPAIGPRHLARPTSLPSETTQQMPTTTSSAGRVGGATPPPPVPPPPPPPATPPAPLPPSASAPPSVADSRPPLPHRRAQTHLAPQLRDLPTESADPAEGPDPGLMSAFQRGFNRAEAPSDESGTHPGYPPRT